MTRWAVVGPTYPFRGGIAHFTTLLVQHLRQRHPVAFYSFRRQYPSWLFPGRSDRDPSQTPLTTEVEYVLDPLNPITWFQTFRRIRRFQPDCLVLNWWVPFWAPAWWTLSTLSRRAGIRVLYICHNVLPHEATLGSRWLAKQVLSRGDDWVTLSREQARTLEKLLPGRKVVYTPHPTYAPLKRQTLEPATARAALGLVPQTPVLLFFGLVRPYKGLSVLLEAMPAVRRATGAVLLVAGEFWEPRQRYEQQITALGLQDAVRLVDQYIPDEQLPLYFGAADVVVLPYLRATQSGVAQLAHGFGRPVIASRVGDLEERFVEGETGLLVPPGDVQALAKAIGRFFQARPVPDPQSPLPQHKEQPSWEDLVKVLERMIMDDKATVCTTL